MSRDLQWAGMSVAIKAADVSAVVAEGGKQALRSYFRDAGDQALELLRQAVGGIPLRSEPVVSVNGPTDDPVQGNIYVLQIMAQVDVLELPAGCTMRAAYDRHGALTIEPGFVG